MDALPGISRVIPMQIPATDQIYTPLLLAASSDITSTHRTTHTYGSQPRQNLDLYHPKESEVGSKPTPILLFFYGGGLVNGARRLARPGLPEDLAYRNVGHFFANRGFLTAVVDYRLVGDNDGKAVFPSGAEDVAAAISWVQKEFGEKKASSQGNGGSPLYLLGNSAGACHVSTYLFHPGFVSSRLAALNPASPSAPRLAAVALLSCPWSFGQPPAGSPLTKILETYYGSTSGLAEQEPLRLLSSKDDASDLPRRLWVMHTELDPVEFQAADEAFGKVWEMKRWQSIELRRGIVAGHVHISPPLALGTGIEREEKWGSDLAAWYLQNS